MVRDVDSAGELKRKRDRKVCDVFEMHRGGGGARYEAGKCISDASIYKQADCKWKGLYGFEQRVPVVSAAV